VTARKREESAQDVPVAITALSEELTSSTIRELRDLNGFAPNVQIDENGSRGGGGASITIRGISPTRSDDNSFDSPIGVMIDGIYLGSLAGQVLENFDIERVEILRGPQGTLFGKNTVGGVVHVLRSRPTGELGVRTKVTAGDDGLIELRGVANMPIIQDVLALKLFATHMEDDGFIKNVTIGGRSAEKDYQNYGATFLYTPNDSFEALLTVEKFKDSGTLDAFHTNYNVARGVFSPPTNPNSTNYSGGFTNCALFPQTCRTSLKRPKVSENDTKNESELDTDAYTLTMKYDINDNLSINSITGYRQQDEYRIYDFDGSSAPFITIERKNDYDQFSQELRLDGSFENLKFTSGIYYWQSEFEQDWVTGGRFWATLFGGVAYNPTLWGLCVNRVLTPTRLPACDSGLTQVETGGDVTQILYETQETESTAAFVQVDYTFLEKFTATAGFRYTEEKKDFIAGQAYLSNVARQWARNFPEYADLSNKWKDGSIKLGLSYQLTDDAIVYGSYSEGFHSGGFFGVNQNTRDFERDQYDPEYGKSWEVGLKSQWLDNRLRLNVTAFLNEFKDKQEQSVQVDPDTLTVATTFDNVANAEYKGFEVETQFVFNEYFSAFLNYGYLDAEYSDFETDINASDGVTRVEDASFLIPRNAPENTLGIGATLTIPVGANEFQIYGKWAFVDEVETALLNQPEAKLDSREDVTASIGYYAENWSLVAYGRNLTNERTEVFTPIATLFAVGSVNRPRSFGIELSYDF
jgi:iron complex outermembrane receptor protein